MSALLPSSTLLPSSALPMWALTPFQVLPMGAPVPAGAPLVCALLPQSARLLAAPCLPVAAAVVLVVAGAVWAVVLPGADADALLLLLRTALAVCCSGERTGRHAPLWCPHHVFSLYPAVGCASIVSAGGVLRRVLPGGFVRPFRVPVLWLGFGEYLRNAYVRGAGGARSAPAARDDQVGLTLGTPGRRPDVHSR